MGNSPKLTKNHYDAAMFAKVSSGEEKGEWKMVIRQMSFIGNFNADTNLKIFTAAINMSKDLELRVVNKNWAYIETNSLQDKDKLKANFMDTILFYSGIFLIYLQRVDESIAVLRSLDSLNSTLQSLDIKSRFNVILYNILRANAHETYLIDNDADKAYNMIMDCERLYPNLTKKNENYNILLARLAYEKGDLQLAKRYTDLASKSANPSFQILLNKAFFAILDGDVGELNVNYLKIIVKRSNISKGYNFVEVVNFLEKEKDKNGKNIEPLFDFAIAALTKLFFDENYGNKLLNDFKREAANIYSLNPLINTADKLLRIVIKQRKKRA